MGRNCGLGGVSNVRLHALPDRGFDAHAFAVRRVFRGSARNESASIVASESIDIMQSHHRARSHHQLGENVKTGPIH